MPETSDAIEREIRIAARPETVFAFFTDPAKMVLWKGTSAELEPQPGGRYRVVINPANVVSGHFVEVVPHERVVFTWGWEGVGSPLPPGASTVEITLLPDGDGTIVRLRHSQLPAEQREQQAAGWSHYLPRLVTVAAGGVAGSDPFAVAM